MSQVSEEVISQLDSLLSQPRQVWFLGAGISKEAGVPLMAPLTDRIEAGLQEETAEDFRSIRDRLLPEAHVEHVLSRIGNLIELSGNSREQSAPFGDETRTAHELAELHHAIQQELRDVVRWGYRPGENGEEEVGSADDPIVTVEDHCQFIKALFQGRRAGLERRPPVAFFTTNYDTLLEDALALNEIRTADGFSGGSTAFWDPEGGSGSYLSPSEKPDYVDAKLYKLHGSIDWVTTDDGAVLRCREEGNYFSERTDRLLVYPQATKYRTTQQEPFVHLFRAFRRAIAMSQEGVLGICGYGFGDEHINKEIINNLKRPSNQLTLIAFVEEVEADGEEAEMKLPDPLREWLSSPQSWTDRIIAVSDQGFYHGNLSNQLAAEETWQLWTFQGLTKFLYRGPEVISDV